MVLVELIGTIIVALSIVYIYYKYVIFNFWHKKGVFCPAPMIPTGNISLYYWKNATTVNKLTMTETTAQSFIFFLAGFETSAATTTFALYELAHHQDIQEIDEILTKHGDLTYDALNEMPYLLKRL